jgi:ABC-type oligopeptide transport system ATPase subunit
MSVGKAILEAGQVHHQLNGVPATQFVQEQLDKVRLPRAFASRRPRDLSGGQRQRVAIARAMATGPEVIVADEAVSALDVSIQTEIVNLLLDLRDDHALSIVFVSHQLPVLAGLADHIAVMRAGAIVEIGPTAQVFASPSHPYTVALLAAHPQPRAVREAELAQGEGEG